MQIFFHDALLELFSISSFLLPALNNFFQLLTQLIDIMAIAIVLISIFQAIKPFLSYIIRAAFRPSQISIEDEGSNIADAHSDTEKRLTTDTGYNSNKKSFIKGLLFALELESANAILKMGVFTASSVGLNTLFVQFQGSTQALAGNFLFFVVILSLRIAINQTLRRFG